MSICSLNNALQRRAGMIRTMKIESLNALAAIFEARFANETIKRLSDIQPPQKLRGMSEAVARIVRAKEQGEAITIVGDYDADGVIAAAILSEVLERCGADCRVLLPNRFTDGYGISAAIIERIDTPLVITVDNGISAMDAAARAKERGIDLIITDHHNCPPVLPDAFAVINPKQAGCEYGLGTHAAKELCGAGVAWYLAAALNNAFGAGCDMKALLALAGVAAVADCVPLLDTNRVFVKAGLAQLNRIDAPFAAVLRSECGTDGVIGYEDIAFRIAPRINAAGRMATAAIAYDFLRANTEARAHELFARLSELSAERKEIENAIVSAAKAQIEAEGASDSAAIVVCGHGWHEGVIGIAAARLSECYGKIAVVISTDGVNAKGSARLGDQGFAGGQGGDLYALLTQCGQWLESFGGHKKAGGIRLAHAQIEPFRQAFLDAARATRHCEQRGETAADGALELNTALITPTLREIYAAYEPFGEGNEQPVFAAHDFRAVETKWVGKDGAHLQLLFDNGLRAIYFNAERSVDYTASISFLYSLMFDSFNGRERVKINIRRCCD
ncbi:single-stranded-DNA-specific exonuclease [Campylobacterota bacterium]|nr:single-stranded-DNA-specific exonuclease [Campylobacterota bacterium]